MSRWKLIGSVVIVIAGATVAWAGTSGPGNASPAWTAATIAGIPSPSPRATSRPRPATFSRDPRFDPPPQLRMPYVDTSGGYWLQLPGRWSRIGGTYGYGQSCVFDLCAVGVSVADAPARTGIRIDTAKPGQGEIVIRGTNLLKIKASWQAAFPDATFSPWTVDGSSGVLAMSAAAGQRAVLVMRDGRLFMMSAQSLFGFGTIDVLRTFLHGFHFLPAACWMEPCRDEGWWAPPDPLVSLDPSAGWTPVGSSWVVAPGPGDRSTAGFASTDCVSDLCSGYVSVSIGTPSTGPVVDRVTSASGASWKRAEGSALAQITASTAELIGATKVERFSLDGIPARHLLAEGREVVVLQYRGRFIVITAFDGAMRQNAGRNLADFLNGFSLVR